MLLHPTSMASMARGVFCKLQSQKSLAIVPKKELAVQKFKSADSSSSSPDSISIVLQPRVCTLRSYGSDRSEVVRRRGDINDDGVSSFFASLSEYIENSRKTQDFEIISGRFAMVVFAATVTVEIVTGNSVFRKMDLQEIAKVAGVCLVAILCSAGFAWFSSARTKVGRIFTISCNSFIDSLIDNLIDGLFYETDPWSDEM